MQVKQPPSRTDHGQASTAASHQLAVERVIHVMRKQLCEPLSIEDMADIAFLSPYHFSRIFHRVIGVPPGEYFTALRLEEAKRLLLTTSLSVTDVCFELGYTSLGSFTTRFTQLVGVPPRLLRRLAGDFTMPSPESLRDSSTCTSRCSHFCRCFFGRISAPDSFTGLIFIGLFPKPIPQGQPVSCTVLPGPGIYSLKSVPDGSYYLLSAALPLSKEPQTCLSPDSGLLVGMSQGPLVIHFGTMSGDPHIILRPPRLIDPPIVLALPYL